MATSTWSSAFPTSSSTLSSGGLIRLAESSDTSRSNFRRSFSASLERFRSATSAASSSSGTEIDRRNPCAARTLSTVDAAMNGPWPAFVAVSTASMTISSCRDSPPSVKRTAVHRSSGSGAKSNAYWLASVVSRPSAGVTSVTTPAVSSANSR